MAKKSSGKEKKSFDNNNLHEETREQTDDNIHKGNQEEVTAEVETEKEENEPGIEGGTEQSSDEKFAEVQDKYLRLSAEFDNYRKRTLKEKADLIRTAGESLILKILPVIDDFDRAIGFLNGEGNVDPSKEGLLLIYNKLKDVLHQQGLREIESLHKEFDTDIHEAVTKISVQEKKLKGKVVDVVLKGYILGEKVIRYPKVVVGE